MKKFVLILMLTIAVSLASPLAASAFAKDKPVKAAAEATMCVCPPDCTHDMASMDPDCAEHKCCKKMAKEARKGEREDENESESGRR